MEQTGSAAFGVLVADEHGEPLEHESQLLGKATNNYAEWSGVLAALHLCICHAEASKHNAIHLVGDSELVTKKIQGKYKVKSLNLANLLQTFIREIANSPLPVRVEHVRREHNTSADALANAALDGRA